MRFARRTGVLAGIALAAFFPLCAAAQESSSRAETDSVASGPVAALRDTLSAACAQNAAGFQKFLTQRNSESFSRMTVSARNELMKRFILLSDAGKASVTTNPAGRPSVRCETVYGTAEAQIGGADLRDNLAFIPVTLRDVTDSEGSAHYVLMGLVREGGQWKILSVGILMLDLPSLEVEWDQAEIGDNEKQALAAIRKIKAAVENYRQLYTHLPESLANLGPPAANAKANAEAAALLDANLASGKVEGYAFRYVIAGANTVGAPAKYEIAATPVNYGRTGQISYFIDQDGTLHGADHRGGVGSGSDPKVE